MPTLIFDPYDLDVQEPVPAPVSIDEEPQKNFDSIGDAALNIGECAVKETQMNDVVEVKVDVREGEKMCKDKIGDEVETDVEKTLTTLKGTHDLGRSSNWSSKRQSSGSNKEVSRRLVVNA